MAVPSSAVRSLCAQFCAWVTARKIGVAIGSIHHEIDDERCDKTHEHGPSLHPCGAHCAHRIDDLRVKGRKEDTIAFGCNRLCCSGLTDMPFLYGGSSEKVRRALRAAQFG